MRRVTGATAAIAGLLCTAAADPRIDYRVTPVMQLATVHAIRLDSSCGFAHKEACRRTPGQNSRP